MAELTLRESDDLLICNECGTQYPVDASSGKNECRICDDPRQYVPATGHAFTTLRKLRDEGHKNVWWQDKQHPEVWYIKTEPSVSEDSLLPLESTSHCS